MNYEEKIEAAKAQLVAAAAVEYKSPDSAHAIRTAVYAIFPELRESKDERVRKGLMKAVAETDGGNKLYGSDVTREEALAWLEKHDPKKHQEELDAAYKTADKVQYHRGYEAAWKEMGEKPPMQNGITINGVEYELIEDNEADECERCALREKCHYSNEVICTQIFENSYAHHRFEKR